MSIKYKVTLKPQEPFFFGAENTFAADDTRKETTRYSATSTHFPQQTAILGMLRKTLLIQSGNLTMHRNGEWVDKQNHKTAVKLTGKDPFSYENKSDLGIINTISPIFITKDKKDYILNAKDESYTPKLLNSSMSLNGTPQKTFILKGFNPKEYKEDSFITQDKTTLFYDDIFAKVQTVGIKKSSDGASNEDAFFQKNSFHLKENATFSFFIELQEELEWTQAYVTLGAEQSSFYLKLEKTKENFESCFANIFTPKSIDRIVLASETLVDQEVYNNTLFVLGSREIYRQIDTRKSKKSKRYYLLTRGSVLYTENLEKLQTALNKPHLQQVGINKYFTIKGTKNV